MKKSALLAVSALSLGVVGLATFTPVVNAVESTKTATITVTVNGTLGITEAQDVTVAAMNADDMKEGSHTVKTTNNTGTNATLTVKDADADTNLVGATPSNTIATNATIAKGTSAWGVKGGLQGEYAAMPASNAAGLSLYTGNDTNKETGVTYGVSTSTTQAADTYTDQVQYTFTAAD